MPDIGVSGPGAGPETGDSRDAAIAARRAWLAVLAKASLAELEAAWTGLPDPPRWRLLRPTETGLALVRGRIGGSGRKFNLGEMTMTRAAVQLIVAGGPDIIGFGHVAGRQVRRAELVALFDAMLQMPSRHDAVAAEIVAPLAARQRATRAALAAKVAPSKVDFLTVVRGE
jgi:alpha-D-ribose 1-methylphosphonate 5-triphosphate synthase subunit PhnG